MNRKLLKRILLISAIVVVAGIFFTFSFVLMVRGGVFGHVPTYAEVANISNITATEIYDSEENLLGKYYLQDRIPVPFHEISPHVTKALIAVEDERFYHHNGIDYKSLLRVIFKTMLMGDESSGGGSTITQQLAKNIFPRKDYAIFYYPINKIREMIIAHRIEGTFTKEEILQLYLNTVSFGNDIYGIESASRRFFNKSGATLHVEEAALLVGMLKATTYYSPIKNPERALNRRNLVIDLMGQDDYLAGANNDSLKQLPVMLDYQPGKKHSLNAYFLDAVRNELKSILDSIGSRSRDKNYNLQTDGLQVYTTLNGGMQAFAEEGVIDHMAGLQQQFNQQWEEDFWQKHPDVLNRELRKVTKGRHEDSLRRKRKMAVFSWEGEQEKEFSSIDSLKYYLQFLHAGFLAVDPTDGRVMAWVGGINHRYFPYDHVNKHARRQVGSVFKPFVYATALEEGISPCKYYRAEQVTYRDVNADEEWTPSNTEENYKGKYSMTGALTSSVNTVSVKILEDVGVERTIKLASDLGIESEIPEVPSIALGTPSISLYEIVKAYSVFVNDGITVPLYFIDKVTDREGNVIYQHTYRTLPRRVLKSGTSKLMVSMLRNVVENGTARSLRTTYGIKNDIGGKTGTTQLNADGWFIGVSPRLVAGVWAGGAYPSISFKETKMGQGATMALPIYARFYQQMNNDPEFRELAEAEFKELPDHLKEKIDCDPFKGQFNLMEWLFGGKESEGKEEVINEDEEGKEKKKKNFFDRIGLIFKKDRKD